MPGFGAARGHLGPGCVEFFGLTPPVGCGGGLRARDSAEYRGSGREWSGAGLPASGPDSPRGYGASCEEFQAHFGDFRIRGIQGQNGRGLEVLQILFSGKPFAASSGYIEHYGFILSDHTAAEGFEQ